MKKHGHLFFLIFSALITLQLSCKKADPETDKANIISVLKGETEAFAERNFERLAGHWKQSPDILFTYTANNHVDTAIGWEKLSELLRQYMNTEGDAEHSNFSRDYHIITVDGDMAWAHFTQTDSLDGTPTQKHESRTLERIGGDWKIIGSNIINLTSFSPNQYLLNTNNVNSKTHIPIKEFPKDMVFNYVDGWGGMIVAVNEPSAGTDFALLLEGLENNSCQVPHWGYLEKGTLRMKYDNGKEEVLQAGDVFYMRPGHTGIVEKDARLIDFGPQKEFKEVIGHIEAKVAAMKKQ